MISHQEQCQCHQTWPMAITWWALGKANEKTEINIDHWWSFTLW
jgi:hypothetical protein